MRSEDAQIGAKVRVSEESGLRHEWRGLTGTVRTKWGNPQYLALDVLLEDRRTQLFWHHELEEIAEGAAHGTMGAVPSEGEERAKRSERLRNGRGSPYAPG